MSMARIVIMAVVLEGRTRSEVAREYGLSRRWVQKLVARYRVEGEAAFEPRSRRPRSNPRSIGAEVEDAIVALRKQLIEAGHDAGAETIAWHMREHGLPAPAVATIWRVLRRRGFVIPQPHKRPRSSWRRFVADLPNEVWQVDITHWRLANGREVEILNIEDDHSRLLVGSTARTVFKAGDIVTDLHAAIAHYGRPERLLTDNGAVFTGAYRGHGWVALEREAVALGIALRHSRPYHPQTCGKVERFHQTLKKWLARQPRTRTLADLQTQLDTFAEYYNHQRPHRGIGRRTPGSAWTARPPRRPNPPRHPDQRTLPRPHRPHRPRRQTHPPAQQPTPPHRHRPTSRRHPGPHARPRARHPRHRRRHRRTAARLHPRPNPRLPAPDPLDCRIRTRPFPTKRQP